MLKLIKKYGNQYIVAPVKRFFWQFSTIIGIAVGLLIRYFRQPKVEPRRVKNRLYYFPEEDEPMTEEIFRNRPKRKYNPLFRIKFIWSLYLYWLEFTKKKIYMDGVGTENGEIVYRYRIWNIHWRKLIVLWYRIIKPKSIKFLRWLSYFIRIRIIYNWIIYPIKVTVLAFWAFWGWKGTVWSWEFWYSQYYAVRIWIIPALLDHINELDEMFKKLILFEWQYSVQEQTIDAFNRIYAVPMRPDSFSDFILVGITILLFFISFISTDLNRWEILKNLINTFLQIWLIIIVIRMLVTVFWSHHLTMYIILHPICFSILLFARSLANNIILDDEDIFDVVTYWIGYFFVMTWMWEIDMFFIH